MARHFAFLLVIVCGLSVEASLALSANPQACTTDSRWTAGEKIWESVVHSARRRKPEQDDVYSAIRCFSEVDADSLTVLEQALKNKLSLYSVQLGTPVRVRDFATVVEQTSALGGHAGAVGLPAFATFHNFLFSLAQTTALSLYAGSGTTEHENGRILVVIDQARRLAFVIYVAIRY